MASYQKYDTKKGERWMFVIENGIDPETGGRRRIVRRGFLKQKDAKAAALELEYQLGLGKEFVKDITFKELAEEWFSAYKLAGKKPSTIQLREYELKHLYRYFAHYKLKDITKKMYQAMLYDLKNRQLSHNFILGINTCAKLIFKYAMKQDILITNPTDYAVIPKDRKTVEEIENTKVQEKYLEKDELQLLLDKAKEMHEETYTMLFVLAWTGMRIGELLALQWKDVNCEEKTINITKTHYNANEKITEFSLLPPKTAGSIRKLTVEDEIIRLLQRHRVRQKAVKLEAGKEYYDGDFVFARMEKPYGYPHVRSTVHYRLQQILKKLPEIEKHITLHSFRHTHTSLLAEAGVELLQIMERLGHTNDATTTQVYLHITKERKKEASQKFGELMRSLSKNG